GITHPGGIQIMFKQITGFLARRIVYELKEGDTVQSGDRFGLMKFSSRMDVLLPADIEIRVQEGDRTVAGETVLAYMPADHDAASASEVHS
ncbi:MAG: phosphatidylserine decarboxylase family protein, partial [Bacteroidetes bacterium]|nr:phosphatidylserine decarboxylase family protein [Bacteroidota bacterium]